MTFARLVSVPENRSALLAVRRVVECLACRRQKRSVNPLYLHGPPGTGKTQLVSVLIQEVTRQCPNLVVNNVAAADFSWQARQSDEAQPEGLDMLAVIRRCDLLVVEDVQHLPVQAAETLVQLFDFLQPRLVQMVFTATSGPRHLDLPARLTSRFAAGLVVGLEPWQVSSRLAILQDKAQRRQLAVGNDVLAWLAGHLTSGRQLEGAITRLETLARLSGRGLDLDSITEEFRDQAAAGRPTMEQIVQQVGGYFRVEPRLLQSQRRSRQVMLPRQVGMYLVRRLTSLSFREIGDFFGGRDHSTVLHACRRVERALTHDAVLAGTVRQLHAELE